MFRQEGETLHENSTSTAQRGGVVVALLGMAASAAWAACAMGTDPDPRIHDGSSQRLVRFERRQDDAPRVVTAPLPESMVMPASAPLGESEVRQVTAPVTRSLVVAVGNNVAHVLDKELATAFLGEDYERRSKFEPFVDRDVVDALMMARADFGLMGGRLSPREQHAGLRQSQLGVELFALAVAPDSPLQSLTAMQVRQVFTGQVTEWKQLGLPGGTIVPVVPADPKLAERAARTMIAGDDFVASATRVASMRHVADQTLRFPGAVAIVKLTDQGIEGVKLLPIDWVAPSLETYTYGTYPYAIPFQLITSGAPSDEGERFLAFARSEEGRTLLGRMLLTH